MVWTGDILTFAHYFQVSQVERNRPPEFRKLRRMMGLESQHDVVRMLNESRPQSDWLTREFSEKRGFFTKENATRIDACRLLILLWWRKGWITKQEKAYLLASLISSMDKVSNTAGTYYAYLKKWYRKAKKRFHFELLRPTVGKNGCRAFLCDAKRLVGMREYDILYLDPPYNERSYAAYYHLPETIARCETPPTCGKCGMPRSSRPSSNFNRPGLAKCALKELLSVAHFRLLAFHYSDDGLIAPSDVRKILFRFGKVESFRLQSIGYTTAAMARAVEHRLYLVTRA